VAPTAPRYALTDVWLSSMAPRSPKPRFALFLKQRSSPRRFAASTRAAPLDLEAFCDGPHTLYICSTGRRQRQFAPLVVALVGDVRDAAYERSRDGCTGPPTLLALDEVANIAPIPDLPAMVSEGAGQGLLVLACLQDLSQARVRWGAAADGFLSLFGTTVVLRGIADTATLRDISALAGDREVAATTVSRSVDRWGRLRPSTSVGSTRLARLPVDAAFQVKDVFVQSRLLLQPCSAPCKG